MSLRLQGGSRSSQSNPDRSVSCLYSTRLKRFAVRAGLVSPPRCVHTVSVQSNIVVAWFRQDTKIESSWYPQVGVDSSTESVHAIYWRCVAVFFSSCRRFNPGAELIFYSNAQLPVLDGVDFRELFLRLQVTVRDIPYAHLPPMGYFEQWRNQFFVLDVLEDLHKNAEPDDAYLVLDTDCVVTQPLDELFQTVRTYGAATYTVEEIAELPSYVSNGLTSLDLERVSSEIAGRRLSVPYAGGELVALSRSGLEVVVAEIPPVWTECLARFERGDPKFNEEAQLLSYIYAKAGLGNGKANPYIRRIWTQRYSTVRQADIEIAVWHLPAEKKLGFKRAFRVLAAERSWFWEADDDRFRFNIAELMGVPKSSTHKLMKDRTIQLFERLRRTS